MLRRQAVGQTGGLLGQYGLSDWWFSTFPEQARKYIDQAYKHATHSIVGLTHGPHKDAKQTPAEFLAELAGRFMRSRQDRRFAYLMLKKAESLAERSEEILTLHKIYAAMERLHAEDRHRDESAKASLENACKKHVEMAPKVAKHIHNLRPDEPLPRHTGFEMLIVLYEKQERYDDAIALCRTAMEQGWSGCYDQHIERCAARKRGEREPEAKGGDGAPAPEPTALCFDCALRLAECHAVISEGAPEIPALVGGICPECKGRHPLDIEDLDG